MNNPFARRFILFTFTVLLPLIPQFVRAQESPQDRWDAPAKEIPLYSGDAPGSENWNWPERIAGSPANPQVQNVVHPELLYYPAPKSMSVGTAVVVCPGGGFSTLMMSYEGVDVARRFDRMGIDAFVLKYRLLRTGANGKTGIAPTTLPSSQPSAVHRGGPRVPPALYAPARKTIEQLAGADGQQAIRLLRQAASDYGIAPDRIGIIGFSAGGAVTLHTIRADADARPNFAILIYGVAAWDGPAPAGAPPVFLAVADDDASAGYEGSIDMFNAWSDANIPVELHIFQIGRHGFTEKGGGADRYLDRVEEWIRVNGFLGRGTTQK